MATTNNRQTNLFAVEDWKKLYTTFSEADFQAYDFEVIYYLTDVISLKVRFSAYKLYPDFTLFSNKEQGKKMMYARI